MGLEAVQKTLARLYTDGAFRERFFADPERTGATTGVTSEEARSLSGMESEVRCFARSLHRKRLNEAAAMLPLTKHALGKEFEPLFLSYASTVVPVGVRKHRDDALGFVRHVERVRVPGALPGWALDLARYEAGWLRARQPGVRCVSRTFRYPVVAMLGRLTAGERIVHPMPRRGLALWVRFLPRGKVQHWVWLLPSGRSL